MGKLAFSKLCTGIMAFDPTLPVNNSAVTSAELRGQFTGLKTLVDGCPTVGAMHNYVAGHAAASIQGMSDLGGLTVSDPPTQAEVQTVVDKLNELMSALQA